MQHVKEADVDDILLLWPDWLKRLTLVEQGNAEQFPSYIEFKWKKKWIWNKLEEGEQVLKLLLFNGISA